MPKKKHLLALLARVRAGYSTALSSNRIGFTELRFTKADGDELLRQIDIALDGRTADTRSSNPPGAETVALIACHRALADLLSQLRPWALCYAEEHESAATAAGIRDVCDAAEALIQDQARSGSGGNEGDLG